MHRHAQRLQGIVNGRRFVPGIGTVSASAAAAANHGAPNDSGPGAIGDDHGRGPLRESPRLGWAVPWKCWAGAEAFVDCGISMAASGLHSAQGACTLKFAMPKAPGVYEFRLYANAGFAVRLATSAKITVVSLRRSQPPPQVSSPQASPPPHSETADPATPPQTSPTQASPPPLQASSPPTPAPPPQASLTQASPPPLQASPPPTPAPPPQASLTQASPPPAPKPPTPAPPLQASATQASPPPAPKPPTPAPPLQASATQASHAGAETADPCTASAASATQASHRRRETADPCTASAGVSAGEWAPQGRLRF